MAKTEGRPQRLFWRQVMRKNREAIICIFLLLSTNAIAGPAKKTFNAIPGGSTKETALAFVEKYEQHLYRGMSLKNLKQYWSASKIEEFNAVAKEMTNVSGSSQFVSLQRLLDVEHANARCEKAELIDIKTTWKINRKAKIEYSVTNICKDWMKPWNRHIDMRYSRSDNRWSIYSITNSEI